MFDQSILSVLTYKCVKRILEKESTIKLYVAQRPMERCMLGITRKEWKNNECIREKTEITDIVRRIK